MSNIGGNYNFGVWNPPSGIDSVKYSERINFNIASQLNNLQTKKEEGFKQNHGTKFLKFKSPDNDLIAHLNDNNLKVFTGMIRQGWGVNAMFPPFPVGFPADDFIPSIHYIPNSNDSCYVVFGIKAVSFQINIYTGNSLSAKVETTGTYENWQGTATTKTKWIRRDKSGNIIEIPVDFTRTYELTFSSGGYYPQYNVSTEWGFQGHSVIVYGKPVNIYRFITEHASSSAASSSSIYQTTFSAFGSNCSNPTSPSPPSSNPATSPLFLGIASPPPPPPKNMDCCDCNTIATIIADQMADQFRLLESIKDHIDLRTKEEIQIFRKQLEALEIDLQPIIDRLNEVERNLWNGIPK